MLDGFIYALSHHHISTTVFSDNPWSTVGGKLSHQIIGMQSPTWIIKKLYQLIWWISESLRNYCGLTMPTGLQAMSVQRWDNIPVFGMSSEILLPSQTRNRLSLTIWESVGSPTCWRITKYPFPLLFVTPSSEQPAIHMENIIFHFFCSWPLCTIFFTKKKQERFFHKQKKKQPPIATLPFLPHKKTWPTFLPSAPPAAGLLGAAASKLRGSHGVKTPQLIPFVHRVWFSMKYSPSILGGQIPLFLVQHPYSEIDGLKFPNPFAQKDSESWWKSESI